MVIVKDKTWGCEHSTLVNEKQIKACIVTISDLESIATELANSVLNSSWMLALDKGTRRSYEFTAKDTANILVKIFQEFKDTKNLGAEFGEVMVSMGSARSLEKLFNHKALPLAEVWKPQKKQNEGFDFHTECPQNLINFGEAKYSGSVNPHGEAIPQASRFVKEEKHLRDRVHLVNLTELESIKNLDNDQFGIIAAFSINSMNHQLIMSNALESIKASDLVTHAKTIYLIGVVC